jgi:hypothetical protein
MRKIGSLLLENNYYYSPLGIKISKRDDKVKCCDNSWTLTQPSVIYSFILDELKLKQR